MEPPIFLYRVKYEYETVCTGQLNEIFDLGIARLTLCAIA